MKFCQFVASLYLHILSDFGRYINAGESYHKLQQKPKTVAEFDLKMHFSWLGLAYRRKPLTTLWKTATSDCRHVCQPTVNILNI